jgi:hypothetical protein
MKMKDNRRDFLRKAAFGSALTSFGGISFLQASPVSGKDEKGTHGPEVAFPGWEVHFDEATSFLSLTNGSVSVSGKLGFVSGSEKWTITVSRDGVTDRYALVDLQAKNVQGYIVFIVQAKRVQILFYHRTAQAYPGILSFNNGTAAFLPDSFACNNTTAKGRAGVIAGNGSCRFAPERFALCSGK